MRNTALLLLEGIAKHFGGIKALSSVDFEVFPNHIHGLIGPNGAGKTTLFNVIAGWYQPDEGSMHFSEQPYSPKAPHEASRIGVARTFQNIRLFSDMSVKENVLVGLYGKTSSGVLSAIFRTKKYRLEEKQSSEVADSLLERVGLLTRAHEQAKTLSYGEQRRLEIARALATDPKLLILDEPAAGMNATEKQILGTLLESLRRQGLTLLLVEHDVKWIMELCDKITVLHNGSILANGSPEDVRHDPAVIAAYVGKKQDHTV